MMSVAALSTLNAQPLSLLASRFEANCRALAQRNACLAERLLQFRPTCEHFIAVQNGQVILIRQELDAPAETIPDPVPPSSARQVCLSIFRDGTCTESVAV